VSLVAKLTAAWPPAEWRDVTVVVAVSGGADSVALLRALVDLKRAHRGPGQLIAAHFNHRLRGTDSDADEAWVIGTCESLDVMCETQEADEHVPVGDFLSQREPAATSPPAIRAAASDEASSREARYTFLRQVVARRGARYLATAHTADDQAETVLHRILRGTGLDGLAGIPFAREWIPGVTLIRPLLATSRREVLDYLDQLRQSFRTDESNTMTRYTRNRLRRDLLPLIERDYNPRVKEALCRLAGLADEAQTVLRRCAADLEERALVRRTKHDAVLDCRTLEDVEPYLVSQLVMSIWETQGWPLQAMSLEKWRQLTRLIRSKEAVSEKADFPGGITVERLANELTLRTQGTNGTQGNQKMQGTQGTQGTFS
jgi:tRNA(Ile)-lysidine synthase